MIFYQKGNEKLMINEKAVDFIDGKIEINDEKLIEYLIADGYDYEEEETEYTVKELRKIAREKGIKDWGKLKKAELLEALGNDIGGD